MKPNPSALPWVGSSLTCKNLLDKHQCSNETKKLNKLGNQNLHKFMVWSSLIIGLLISFSVIYYSVTGMVNIFYASPVAIAILMISIEIAKLLLASSLKLFWNELSRAYFLRLYMILAVLILMGITCLGVYGFLSSGIQTSLEMKAKIEHDITTLETQIENIGNDNRDISLELSILSNSISDLRNGLSGNTISYVDGNGNRVQTTSSAQRKALEQQLEQSVVRQTKLDSSRITNNNTMRNFYSEIDSLVVSKEKVSKLGVIQYISEIVKIPESEILLYFILAIILVLDPLAIALILFFTTMYPRLGKINEVAPEDDIQVEDVEAKEDVPFYDMVSGLFAKSLGSKEISQSNLPVTTGGRPKLQ